MALKNSSDDYEKYLREIPIELVYLLPILNPERKCSKLVVCGCITSGELD